MGFFGFGKSYIYPKYYYNFRTSRAADNSVNVTGSTIPNVAFSGSVSPILENTITYTLGAFGAGGVEGANNGQAGGETIVTFSGVTMTGSGGSGGWVSKVADAAPGTGSGGSWNWHGSVGSQPIAVDGNHGGGGGGSIGQYAYGGKTGTDYTKAFFGNVGGGGGGVSNEWTGQHGARSFDARGLRAAVARATNYDFLGDLHLWTGSIGSSVVLSNFGLADGGHGGFGHGGGGAGRSGGNGGHAGIGGGGGGAAHGSSHAGGGSGGSGGSGSVVVQYTDNNGFVNASVLTNGTSYTVPSDVRTVEIWAIGGGGGGGGAGTEDADGEVAAGGGGGAGVAYKCFGECPDELDGIQMHHADTNWLVPWTNSVPNHLRGTGSFAGATHMTGTHIPQPYIQLSPMTIPTTWTFSGWARCNSFGNLPAIMTFDNGPDNSRITAFGREEHQVNRSQIDFVYNENDGAGDDRISLRRFLSIGEWFHWSWTCDGSTMKVYKNGLLTGSKSLTNSQIGRTLHNCHIGGPENQAKSVGTYNQRDFCIHNVALDPGSVLQMYSGTMHPSEVSASNIIQYFSLDPYEFDSIGRGQSFSPHITSSCTSAISSSVTGNIVLSSSASPRGGTDRMKIAPSSSAAGYLTNNAWAAVDGVNDVIHFPVGCGKVGTAYTMQIWAQRRDDADYLKFFEFGNNDGVGAGQFGLETGGTGYVGVDGLMFVNRDGATLQLATASNQIPLGEWCHIVGVLDPASPGPNMKLYNNGILLTTRGAGGDTPSETITSVGHSSSFGGIMRDIYSSTPANTYKAAGADACLWNTVLSAETIDLLHSGSVRPHQVSSSNVVFYLPLDEGSGRTVRNAAPNAISSSFSGTILNTACAGYSYDTPFSGIIGQDPNPFRSYEFDGQDSMVVLPTLEFGKKFAITGWARTDKAPASPSQRMFTFGNPSPQPGILADEVTLYQYDGSDAYFYIKKDHTHYDQIVASDFWEVGKWIHFACVVDGANQYLYKNGTLIEGRALTYPKERGKLSYNTLGNHYSYPRGWLGGIAEFAIWDTDLTDMQVKQLYNSGNYIDSNRALEYKGTYLSGTTHVTGAAPDK